MNIEEWKKLGKFTTIGEHKLFTIDTEKNKDTLLILHGYPSSSYDFQKALPVLSKYYRVIIHDHIGFGFSDKPLNYSYSIIEQADKAMQLWIKLGITTAHLAAHDYGTTVATEIITRRNMGYEPVKFKSLTLCNGSVHIEFAKLRLIQKLLRNKRLGPVIAQLSSYHVFKKNMKKLWHDESKIDLEEINSMWELLTLNSGKKVLPKITQYLRERELYWNRWVGALKETDLKTNILWGRNDPITGEEIAKLHHEEMIHSKLKLLNNIGHYPMIENSDYWATALLEMIDLESK